MTALRLLQLEQHAADAERIATRLQEEGLDCAITWVTSVEDLVAALQREDYDIVLCDCDLGGLDALRQVRAIRPDVPMIALSADMNEQEAVECMHAGATDYVLKTRLRRLGFSVRRTLVEERQKAALRHAEEDLRALNAELEARVRQRTSELETANAFLGSVIEHIPYMVMVKNAADLSIVRVNRSMELISGRSQDELVGRTTRDFVSSPEEAEFFDAKDREALSLGREVDIPEETFHAPDGTAHVLHAKKLPIFDDESGQPRYLLVMAEDVTERKKKEREIERLNTELASRSAEVEAANRAKGTFLATMSHEIRTPMHGMLGMLELLGLTELDGEQRETLGLVRESSRSLLRIIDDILDFSKIEAGKLEVRPEVVSIKRLIEEVQSIYLGNASSKGLVVRRMVDPRISPALRVDPVRLRQILNNFVSNAIKFTAEGWIDINVQFLGRDAGRESLRFEVKDTGAGISPQDQQRLFQPFSQALGDAGQRHAGGSGLGLVISRQLAHLMGGTIHLDSAPGRGTTIVLDLTLPIADGLPGGDDHGARVPAPTARRHAPEPEEAEREGTLVLLVDDHPVNRMLLLRQVRALGYAGEATDDGVQALAAWQSGRFGLVITDCHMPRMDGYELARSIRRLEAEAGRDRVPIVACTANALQGEAEACLAAGMDDFLVKPVELGQLMQKLDRWLPIPAGEPQPVAPSPPRPAVVPASDSPIDRALLWSNCGHDASVVAEVLETYRSSSDDDVAGLRLAVAAEDAPRVAQFAHRMAGASRMVGAMPFAAASERVDRAARSGDWQAVLAALPAWEEAQAALAAYLEGHATA